MIRTHADIARACFQAYVEGDRAALDAVLSPDLRFTSPYDHAIDLQTYLDICWPSHAAISDYRFIRTIESGDEVVVTYELQRRDGTTVRNTEVLTLRAGRIEAVEVYFGWNVPHPVPKGRHLATGA